MNSGIKRALAVSMAVSMLVSVSACSKKNSEATTTSLEPTPTPIPIETTTVPTTSLSEFSGPDTNVVDNPTWTETEMEATTMYVSTSDDYLNVRRGPDSAVYTEVVSRVPRGAAVVVVASTSNGWYKTADGYYLSGSYLSSSPVN